MNRKGTTGEFLKSNIGSIILLVLVAVGLWVMIWSQMNGAGVWEDYYAKEIVKVIDFSKPGDEIRLDVHKGTEIAKRNKILSFSEIFEFDNSENKVCVKFGKGKKSCYYYFNDVDIRDPNLELGTNDGKNALSFKIGEKQKEVENV